VAKSLTVVAVSRGESVYRNSLGAWIVHCYTASGFLWALLTASCIAAGAYWQASIWMLVALAVDSTDGFLARRLEVKENLPAIDGRKLDDLADFLNYTFLPIFMIINAGWVPEPVLVWGVPPVIASAFAFSHQGAKEEVAGCFRGFPSYWNVFSIYILLWLSNGNPWITAVLILFFSILSLMPVRFVYPSRTRIAKRFFIWGGIVWTLGMFVILLGEGYGPMWAVYLSLFYPAAYLASPILIRFREKLYRSDAGVRLPGEADPQYGSDTTRAD